MKIKLWFYILIFMTACSPLSPEKAVLTPTAVITDPTSLPTSTFTPSTETALPAFTPIPTQPFSMDNIRMVYAENGKIYLKDGLNSPRQLTFSGRDRDPILSDDGKKIVFYRGDEDDHVYSINANGSDELLIIERKSMPVIGQGELRGIRFVPYSQILVFNSYLCNAPFNGPSYNAAECTVGVYSVDTNSGEMEAVVSGLNGNRLQYQNFEISPDGKLISVAASGHVDIYGFSGSSYDLIYPDAISYYRTKPDEYLPPQYWLPDSSGFLAIVSTDEFNEPTTPPLTYAAFRYTMKDKKVVPMALEEEITRGIGYRSWSISPDRNWIFFASDDTYLIGNLVNGNTQVYEGSVFHIQSFQWSPDSKHFAFGSSHEPIGAVDGSVISIEGYFLNWLDVNHYLAAIPSDTNPVTFSTYIGEIGGESRPPPEGFRWSSEFVILPSTPAP